MSFDVACSSEHAFSMWTARIGSWWPPDHTVSAEADVAVVLQAGVGGRIYERTRDGREHDWGEITAWEPPARLAYVWHLGRARADATEVEIRFVAQGDAATRVEVEHRGWDRLADGAETWRDRNRLGWQTLLPHFQLAAEHLSRGTPAKLTVQRIRTDPLPGEASQRPDRARATRAAASGRGAADS